MMKRALPCFLACAAVICLLAGPGVSFATSEKQTAAPKQTTAQKQPPAGARVLFNYQAIGTAASKLVDEVWKVHPDYKPVWDKLQLLPDHAIGLADVNGDNKPEIFVRHSEPNWGFCDKEGFACRTHVYAYTGKGLVEIADFRAADPIVILPSKTNNLNNLYAAGSDDIGRVYSWGGKRYELAK